MSTYAEFVRLAEDAALQHPRADVETICRMVEVRYRTLYRAFLEVRGCAPLKAIRLKSG